MKMKNLLLLSVFTLVITGVFAQGQPGVFTVSGTIADSVSQKPLDLLSVNLMKDPTTVVKVTYSRVDGTFSFARVARGNYQLVIMGIGYRTKRVDVNLSDSLQTNVVRASIYIAPDIVGLKEVKVTALKPVVIQEVDRLVYDLQADPESKTYSALEMMRKVPLLSLDADNNLYMKGNSDFKILINGKPSSMMERSYRDVLRSMPASSIDRIEVITSPPAKYDAEGLAGIINIITNKKIDNGYNGSLNVSERFPVGGPGIGGTVTAKLGKLGISGFGGASIYHNPETRNTIDRATYGLDPTHLNQQGFNKSDNRNGYIGLEMSYELDSLNLISMQLNSNGSNSSGRATQNTSLTDNTEMIQGFRLRNLNEGNGNGLDAAFNYQKGFRADKNRLLTLSYRRFSYNNYQTADLHVSERVNYNQPDYQQPNDQHFSEQTFQVDYVHPWKKLRVEAGLKGILRNNSSDFQYLIVDGNTGQYVMQQTGSNRFRNTQNVFGAYNSYQYNFKKWGVKAGFRIEETVIDADFISTESTVKRTYFNVIPSMSVNRKLKNNQGINMAYTQRIQRPGIYQLNPFVDRSNPNFERTGNPDLRPALVNDIQFGYTRPAKATLNVGLGFNYFRDLFFPVSVYDSTTNVTRTSFGNTGTAKLPMAYVNFNYPITKKWNLSLNSRAAYGMVQGIVNGIKIKNQGLMYHLFLSTGYKFEKEWRLNANINLSGPNLQFQGTSNITFNTSLSVSKDLIKDKFSFSAGVNNPFTKFRKNHNYTFGPDFDQDNRRWDYFRTFNFSMNYKFGKLKESIKKNQRGIRNDDVQGGN
jgi:ferric enterobactin receptor